MDALRKDLGGIHGGAGGGRHEAIPVSGRKATRVSADMRAIKRLAADMGVNIVMFPDTSNVHDKKDRECDEEWFELVQ